MDWTLVIEVAKNFGLPVGVMLAMAIVGIAGITALWTAGKRVSAWMAKEVIIPFRNRHFAFLGTVEETSQKQVELLTQQAAALDRIDQTVQTQATLLASHTVKLDRLLTNGDAEHSAEKHTTKK